MSRGIASRRLRVQVVLGAQGGRWRAGSPAAHARSLFLLPILTAMKMTPADAHAVAQAASAVLPTGARVLLFGSRVDDARRGGDLDLLVETSHLPAPDELVRLRNRFTAQLYRRLGERRIDVLMAELGAPDDRAVVLAARRDGVELAAP